MSNKVNEETRNFALIVASAFASDIPLERKKKAFQRSSIIILTDDMGHMRMSHDLRMFG